MRPNIKAAVAAAKSKKQEMSQKAKRWDKKDVEYRENEDGTTSTHKMAYAKTDNGGIAFPTVFPKKREGTVSHKKEDWIEPKGWAALDTAKARGEVYEFSNARRAKKWAQGKYKKN